MQEGNNKSESFNTDSSSTDTSNDMANKGRGGQGIDKAPGEETAQNLENMKSETQQGKKVDRDFTQSNEEPLNE